MTSSPNIPDFPIARALLAVGGVSAVLGLLAWFGMNALGLPAQAHDAAVTLAAVSLAGVAGLLLVRPMEARMPGGAAWGFLAGSLVRLPLCAVFVFAAPRLKWTQGASVADWLAGWYVLLTLVEAAIVGRHVKQTAAARAVALRGAPPAEVLS